MTPLIDVVFLLLIFFTITTSFRQDAPIRINPPEAPEDAQAKRKNIVEVWIDKDGHYYVDQKSVSEDMETLRQTIRLKYIEDKGKTLFICADADTTHDKVVKAMNVATQVGFSKASICTIRPKKEN